MAALPWEAIVMVILFILGGVFTVYRIVMGKIESVEERIRHECLEVSTKFDSFKDDIYRNYTQKVDIDVRFKSIEDKIDKVYDLIIENFGRH